MRKRYPSDLTDAQWSLIAPLLPPAKRGGRPRTTDLRDRIRTLHRALLVMHSPTDNTVGVRNASLIFQTARHPRSFVALEGADHLLTGKGQAARAARITASARLWASSFARIAATWYFAVFSLMPRSRAMALFGRPSASRVSTSRSRGLSVGRTTGSMLVSSSRGVAVVGA